MKREKDNNILLNSDKINRDFIIWVNSLHLSIVLPIFLVFTLVVGFAEGKTKDPITEEDIRKYLLKKCGYKTKDINIWWDDMMGLWQWNCDITPA